MQGSAGGDRPQRRSEAPAPPADAPRQQAAAAPQQEVPMDSVDPAELHADAAPGDQPAALGAPPQDLGQVPVAQVPAQPGEPGAGAPLDLSALIRRDGSIAIDPAAAPQQTAAVSPTGDVRADYEAAYQHVLAGDYQLAEAGFRSFVSAYPNDGLAGDAQYLIGESLYTRGLYKEAAAEFLSGFKTYPDSGKAPDTLLKLGMSLAGLGEHDAACASYSQVLKQFPGASYALRQRVEAEQASGRC
jgi:tol-pal system protein YbgF